jgi:putative ABC transport system permease protein
MLVLFLAIVAAVAVSAARNRVLLTLAIRNFRRKGRGTVIVVAGLMIGTAIISSSMVIGDSFNTLLAKQLLDELGGTDEVYGVRPAGVPVEQDFPEKAFDDLEAALRGNSAIDGLSPELRKTGGVLNNDRQLIEPRSVVSGFSFKGADALGAFYIDGRKVPSLPEGQAMVGRELAREIDARPGDRLSVFFLNRTLNVTVLGVLDARERGLFPAGLFMEIGALQEGLGLNGTINRILVSNAGDRISGMERTDEVRSLVSGANIAAGGQPLVLLREKKAEYDKIFEEGFFLGDILLIFGLFTIIAGVILIINIFVMLAEERRPEIGMARAVGMNKKDIRSMYMYEGTVYGLLASFAGTLLGLATGLLLLIGIGGAFATDGSSDVAGSFTVTAPSVLMSFIAGFLITIGTVFLTTRRIMETDIIRAIRGVPEPPRPRKDKRLLAAGALLMVLGLMFAAGALAPHYDGKDNNSNGTVDESREAAAAPLMLGLTMFFFGLPLVLRRVVPDRAAYSFGAVAVLLVWSGLVWSFMELEIDIFTFFFAGMFIVVSIVLLVISNSGPLARLFERAFSAGGRYNSVMRVPLKYSLASKSKTGLTMVMFSLVIFILTFFSILLALVDQNIDSQLESSSGGFDILVRTAEPVSGFETAFGASNSSGQAEKAFFLTATEVTFNKFSQILGTDRVIYPLYGIDDGFMSAERFRISKMLPEFGGDTQRMFSALKENRTYVIADSSVGGSGFGPPATLPLSIGETQEVALANGSKLPVRVIAFMDTFQLFGDPGRSLNGVFMYRPYAESDFNATGVGAALFDLRPGADKLAFRRDVERTFLPYGAQTVDFKEQNAEQFKSVLQVFNLLNAYLGLGLVVGIAGLGIISTRSVSERQGQIGMLRAIGYNRRQILAVFLIESTYISILGIIVGTAAGLIVASNMYTQLLEGQGYSSFLVPWGTIGLIILVTVAFSILSTIPPSRAASTVEPAKVLRFA